MGTASDDATRRYYDAFAARYEAERGARRPGGYHELLDTLEAGFVERFGTDRDVLEVGCGTGLVLSRIARFAARAEGVDLSPAMLDKARARGLTVHQGSATALPFPDASFDVSCAFKVLAHVPAVEQALAEMCRVTRPGGVIIAELYNPWSLRGLVKRLGPAGEVARGTTEAAVYTRFDSPSAARGLRPEGCELLAERGVRIVTPAAVCFRVPGLRRLLWYLESSLADGPLKAVAGFHAVAFRKGEKRSTAADGARMAATGAAAQAAGRRERP